MLLQLILSSFQNNQFTGSINVLASLPLQNLNVANNHFSGWIPNVLKKKKVFRLMATRGAQGLLHPHHHLPPSPPGPKVNPGHTSGGSGNSQSKGDQGGKSSGIRGGGIAGIITSWHLPLVREGQRFDAVIASEYILTPPEREVFSR